MADDYDGRSSISITNHSSPTPIHINDIATTTTTTTTTTPPHSNSGEEILPPSQLTPSAKSTSASPTTLCTSGECTSVNKLSFETVVASSSPSWLTHLNPFSWLPSWRPTSMNQLFQAETQMLRLVKANLDRFFVNVCNDKYRIWTLVASRKDSSKVAAHDTSALTPSQNNVPLVMIHGMGGGNGIWAMNYDELAKDRTVYTFDLLGFGLSSRPKFSSNPSLCESELVDSVESWRQAMQLQPPFILLGHSLGGFIAAKYAIRHPSHVQHLILADPWGVPEMPKEHELGRDWPMWVKALRVVMQPFNPLAMVRGAGPWGPTLVRRFRPDFQRRYSQFFDNDDTVFDYIYHLNAQTPSGEAAFKTLAGSFGFAKEPVIAKIGKLDAQVPITFVYGAKSWIDSDSGNEIQKMRSASYVDVQMIQGAGHHVYADRPKQFNAVVNEVAQFVDQHLDANLNAADCCVPPPEDAEGGAGGAGDAPREKPRSFPPLKKKENSGDDSS